MAKSSGLDTQKCSTQPAKGEARTAARVPLIGGGAALIDPCDAHLAREYEWRPGGTGRRYAVALVKDGDALRSVYLHRLVMGAAAGDIVDHVNGDPLDCRRANLRMATASQNSANRLETTSETGFRGIAFYPHKRKWQARITRAGLVYRGPYRPRPELAAHDADDLLRGLFGASATLNFPRAGERGVRRA